MSHTIGYAKLRPGITLKKLDACGEDGCGYMIIYHSQRQAWDSMVDPTFTLNRTKVMTIGEQVPTPTSDEVISALNRTGFLLESRAAKTLREAGFYVRVNDAFPDPESGKSREIDVYASIDLDVTRPPVDFTISGEVVLECKNSSAPFVLIGDRNHSPVYDSDAVILGFDPLSLTFPGARFRSMYPELGLYSPSGYRAPGDFIGHQLIRMSRTSGTWKADNSSVYDSILYPLAKAFQYRHELNTEEDEGGSYHEWTYLHLIYIFPVIVTAGQVLTVDVGEDEPQVNAVPWASLTRSFSSKDLNADLMADVVSFEYYEDYLNSRILATLNNVKNTLAANIHLYDPEWLLANLGQPKNKELFDAWLTDIRTNRKRPSGTATTS